MGQQLLAVRFKLAEAGRNCRLAAGACPWRAVGTAPVPTLTARALRPAACHLARPHLFFQVSTSGVKSSSPAANPPGLPSSYGTAMSALPPQHPAALRARHAGVLQLCLLQLPSTPTQTQTPNQWFRKEKPTSSLKNHHRSCPLALGQGVRALLLPIRVACLWLTDFRVYGRKVGGLQTCTMHDAFAQCIGVRRGMSPGAAIAPSGCSESTAAVPRRVAEGLLPPGECSCTRLGQAA